MLINYITTGFRYIRKSKINFAFKLGGLSVAMCCLMAIAIHVTFQLSFDTFHDDFENVYRVGSHRKENGTIDPYAIVPLAVGPLLQQLPEVAYSARLTFGNHTYIRYNDRSIDCEGMTEADSSIFDVLSFTFIEGDKSALVKPNAIVLTRSFALRAFGTTDVLQKLVGINAGNDLYEVTAVIEDVPSNSHLWLQAMTRIRSHYELTRRSVADPVVFSDEASALYLRLRPSSPAAFLSRANALLKKFVTEEVATEHGFDIFLQPVADIHLDSSYRYDAATHGNAAYVYTFSTLGILLLLVAGINYVNLSIADYSSRTRETGVRKVLGARSAQLHIQVALEAGLICLAALALAGLLLYLMFPKIAELLDPDLRFNMVFHPSTLIVVGLSIFVLMLLSCWIPARQLDKMRVVHNLQAQGSGYNGTASRLLLFTQFSVSILCIYCTLVVSRQVNFMHNKSLGFDRKNLLVLSMPVEFTVNKLQAFKTELKRIAGVAAVSNSSFRIGGGYWKDWYFVEDGDHVKEVELYEVFSDDELFSTLGIPVLKGRTFNSNMPSDSGAAFVINETAARVLGWEDPVGKRIYTHPEEKGKWDGTVVGVVPDINISPLYSKVQPLVMRLPWQSSYPDHFVYVRFAGDENAVVKAMEEKYKMIMPGYPLLVRQVDELYNSTHRGEERAFALLKFGTLAIVFVSMMGIFSMAAFMSIKRMKEFGIRKVLGASLQQITVLHLTFFLRIAVLSNLLALPVAYGLMSEWMNNFAYRTEITAGLFFVAGGMSILLIAVSGGYSALKSGMLNPIHVIKAD